MSIWQFIVALVEECMVQLECRILKRENSLYMQKFYFLLVTTVQGKHNDQLSILEFCMEFSHS